MTNLVGTVLLLTVGGLSMAYYCNQYNRSSDKSVSVKLSTSLLLRYMEEIRMIPIQTDNHV